MSIGGPHEVLPPHEGCPASPLPVRGVCNPVPAVGQIPEFSFCGSWLDLSGRVDSLHPVAEANGG